MSKTSPFDLKIAMVCGAVVLLLGVSEARAQSQQQIVPNFIDARPLPQTEKARADEAAAKRKAEEELKRLAAEADAKRKADEEARRAAADAEAKQRAEQEARRLAAEADAKRRAEEEARRIAAEAEAKRIAEQTEEKRKVEEEGRRLAAEAQAKRLAAEAEAKRKAEEDANRLAAEAEAKRQAAEALAKRQAEEEARRVAEAEGKRKAEEAARRAEIETRRVAAEAEAQRLAAEAEAKRRAEADANAQAAKADTAKGEPSRLLTRGRQLLGDGDIVGARLILERAALGGDADAASLLADTYDAVALNRMRAFGVPPDAALAERWRIRAHEIAAATTAAQPIPALSTPATSAPAASTSTAIATPQPPPVVPAPVPAIRPIEKAAPAISAEAQRYIARGQDLLSQGDIDAARLFFDRALQSGAAQGAMELAATYDPIALAELGVVGLQPDPAMAAKYYRQAQQMGVGAAAERLARLGAR